MRILVTGGAGYIGSTLTQLLLEQGHQVRVIDTLLYGGRSLLGFFSHPHFEFLRADLRDRKAVVRAVQGMDAIVHLAAIVGDPACARQPKLAREVNLDASLELFEVGQRQRVRRFVFASTCSNYGKMADPSQYVTEESELHPVSLYAETKVAVEKALLDSVLANEPAVTVLRFATVFGVSPRMRFDLTVNHFTMELLSEQHLVVFGEQFWRPYVHVRDAARAVLLTLKMPAAAVKNEVFNVGSTAQNYQKQQLVEMICPYIPEAEIEYVHREEDPRDYRVSFSKIRDQLGFEPSISVEDGIREVAQLVRDGIIQDVDNPKYRN